MSGQQSLERPRPFLPTPEKISRYIPLKAEEIKAEMMSVEGRKMLLEQLVEKQADIQKDHPDFHPDKVRDQLDMGAELLQAEGKFMENIQAPEKKSLMRRVWDAVTWLPRKHPLVTTLLAAAAIGAGASYMGWIPGLDLAALWARLQSMVPWNWGSGAAGVGEAAGEAAAETAAEVAAEAAKPEFIDIVTHGPNILHEGKEYAPEAFGEIIDQLKQANPEGMFRINPHPSSQWIAEENLRDLLDGKNLEYWDLTPGGATRGLSK